MQHRAAIILAITLVGGAGGACSPAATPSSEAGVADAGAVVRGDEGPPDAPRDAGKGTDPDRLPASDYCETLAPSFCAFYMRCGRMVAKDEADCRAVFLESCNARYEPRYVDLEAAGLLGLSRAGVDACTAHLGAVTCEEQASDLDGPCGRMWRGTSAKGEGCGIDVESFVCGAGTTCILGLDFCGTCETSAPRGGACEAGVVRCASEDACIAGSCVARALSGEACGDAKPCITGSTCTDGTCMAPAIVGEGEPCDARRRCAYRSYCEGGQCVRAALLGEPCATSRACTSGRCEGGTCVALRDDGATCASPAECSSGQCVAKVCTPLPSACITR